MFSRDGIPEWEGITPGRGEVGDTQISEWLEVFVADKFESVLSLLHVVGTDYFHSKFQAALLFFGQVCARTTQVKPGSSHSGI